MTFFISVKALSPPTSTSSTFSSKFDLYTFKHTSLIYLQSNLSLIYLQSNTAWFIYNQTHLISTQERGLAKSVGSSWGFKAKILSFCLLILKMVWFEIEILDIGVRSRFDLCRACSRAPYSHTGKINSFVLEDLHLNSILGVSKSYHPKSTVKYLVNYKCQHTLKGSASCSCFHWCFETWRSLEDRCAGCLFS